MVRTALIATICIAWASPLLAQAGGMTPRQLREQRDRLIAERRGVEASGGFTSFWAGGDKWLQTAKNAGGEALSETTPSSVDAGIHAEKIEALIQKLGDSKIAVRKDARKKLIEIGPPAATPLAQILTDLKSKMKASAKVTLGEMGPPAFAAILPLLDHKNGMVRRDALSVLKRIFEPDHLGVLVGLYKRTDNRDVKSGLKKLFISGMQGKDKGPMLQMFKHEKDANLRLIAISALAAQGDIDVLPVLIEATNVTDRRDRKAIAVGNSALKAIFAIVARIRDKAVVPKLFAVYKTAPERVKKLIRPKLQSLGSEDPNAEANFKFFFYVRSKNMRPNAGGGWPRRT